MRDSLKRPFAEASDQRGQLRRLTTLLHQRYLLAVTTSETLALPPRLARELKVLKEITACFVYGELRSSQEKQKEMIKALFRHFYVEGDRDRKVFDQQIQDSLAEDEKAFDQMKANLARAAADQIATMTEDDVVRRHQQIT